MPDSDGEYDEAIVVDLVEEEVVADSDSIRTVLTLESNASWWTRLVRQEVDRGADALLIAPVQTGQ